MGTAVATVWCVRLIQIVSFCFIPQYSTWPNLDARPAVIQTLTHTRSVTVLDHVLGHVRSVLTGEAQGYTAVHAYLLDAFAARTGDLQKVALKPVPRQLITYFPYCKQLTNPRAQLQCRAWLTS